MFVGGGREREREGRTEEAERKEMRVRSADGRGAAEGKRETPKGATVTSVGKSKEQIRLAQRAEGGRSQLCH